MSCETVDMPGAMFCLWGTPQLSDLDRLLVSIRASFAAARGPIVYVTRIPANAPPPESHVRGAIARAVPELTTMCSSYHVILEGDGFAAACKRGVMLSLVQLSAERKKFRVHAHADEVLKTLQDPFRETAAKLLEEVRKQGLLDRPCLSIPASAR
jgi:cytosine/adenosine deaminase-related metal-dependent hydrolase